MEEKTYYVLDPATGSFIEIDNESFNNLERIYDEVVTVPSQKNPSRHFIVGVVPNQDIKLKAVPKSLIKRV